MAHDSQLPCDGEGICMLCRMKPSEEETIICRTCLTPWHLTCLPSHSKTPLSTVHWECSDCSPISGDGREFHSDRKSLDSGHLIASVREIEADLSLSEREKAKKRQRLMSRGRGDLLGDVEEKKRRDDVDVMDLLDENFNCSFCMKLPDRPVTTPCGHNFCLKCFQKWIGQGKRSCAKCRMCIPNKMANQPHINSSLVVAIRMAKISKSVSSEAHDRVYHFIHNQQLPEKAFTTERAKKTGKANACSGKIFVTVPPDHFGPILAENDPERKQGVLVGECWEDRMECRQWGAHLPHVAGIAGQSAFGAQSVALSGGYEDDEDHGEWFLYTGSGGRDLSGNRRTNKAQSFDQKFEKGNEALRVSCKKGYPVRVVRGSFRRNVSYKVWKGDRVRFWEDVWIGERALCSDYGDLYAMSNRKNQPVKNFTVVDNGNASWDIDLRQAFNDWEIDDLATLLGRLGPPPLLNQEEDKHVSFHDANGHFAATSWSNKEMRSSYSPEKGVRYDGVYRIEKCWRKIGVQGFKVCRYLFVRCDNEAAPWTSDEYGDRPRPLPVIKELKGATDVTEREEGPSWDYDDEDCCWKWKKSPPLSRRPVSSKNPGDGKRARKARRQVQNLPVREKLLKEFSCLICMKVLNLPLTTPCAHNFCKTCLEGAFSGQTFVRERTCGWRTLRAQKNVMQCPACPNDISDFLKNPQISRELMGMIESLQHKTGEENVESLSEEESFGTDVEHSETEEEDNESQMQDAIEIQQNYLEHRFEQVYKRRKVDAEVLVSKSNYVDICQCMEDEKMRVKCCGTKRPCGDQVVHYFLEKVYERRKVNVETLLSTPKDSVGMENKEMRVEDNLTEKKDGTAGVHNFLKHKSQRVYKRKVNLDALILKPGEIDGMDTFSGKENSKTLYRGRKDEVMRVEENEIQRQDCTKAIQNLEACEQDCKWRKAEDGDVLLNDGSTENSKPKSKGKEDEEMEEKFPEKQMKVT